MSDDQAPLFGLDAEQAEAVLNQHFRHFLDEARREFPNDDSFDGMARIQVATTQALKMLVVENNRVISEQICARFKELSNREQ